MVDLELGFALVNLTGLDADTGLLAGPMVSQGGAVQQTSGPSASFLMVDLFLDFAEDQYGHQVVGYLVLVEEDQHDLEENFQVVLACCPLVKVPLLAPLVCELAGYQVGKQVVLPYHNQALHPSDQEVYLFHIQLHFVVKMSEILVVAALEDPSSQNQVGVGLEQQLPWDLVAVVQVMTHGWTEGFLGVQLE